MSRIKKKKSIFIFFDIKIENKPAALVRLSSGLIFGICVRDGSVDREYPSGIANLMFTGKQIPAPGNVPDLPCEEDVGYQELLQFR